MNQIVNNYEEDFSSTSAEITVLCGKLKHAPDSSVSTTLINTLDQLTQDAEETLEQMELEVPNLEAPARDKLKKRLLSYGGELDRLKALYRGCRRDAEERSARMELFTQNPDFADIKETDQLIENMEILDSSGRQLEAGRRLLRETEDIGAGVLEDLGHQREVLERSRGRLRDVEAGLGSSSSILNKMMFRAQQNKLVLYLVAIVIIVAVLVAFYFLIVS